MDDTVTLDRPEWIAEMLSKYVAHIPAEQKLFPMAESETVRLFREAAGMLGLPGLCMYQLRHGGASEDLLSGAREAELIRARG
eukprot:11400413-Alexandrium_andersonii.AAC.1